MIDKKDLLDTCCPMLVTLNDNESDAEFEARWKKFDSLPENIREILSSIDTANVVAEIANRYNLSSENAIEISRVIRSYFFGELSLNLIGKKLAELIPTLDVALAENISQIIKDEIIFAVPKKTSSAAPIKTVDISLLQAMQKYSKLGEQLLTSSQIKLKIFSQPVRPSIKNWIEDYHQSMGAQKHGMMERGNYLFHSENTKKITYGERKKLAEILRSVDEDVALKIDPEKQEVIFAPDEPEFAPVKKTNSMPERTTQNFAAPNRPAPYAPTNQNYQAPAPSVQPNPQNRFGQREQTVSRPSFSTPQQQNNIQPRTTNSYQTLSPEEQNHDIWSGKPAQAMNQNMPNRAPVSAPSQVPPAARRVPTQPSFAGKSYEEMVNSSRNNSPSAAYADPKIQGNIVDLKN